jgi:processive 1,2-diacylglycerol beta-glucosyltransferase
MLIHHIVPGQEEGNIELLERLEVGRPATDPQKISDAIGRLLGDKGALWRQQKANLLAHAIPDSAANAAKFIESKLPNS